MINRKAQELADYCKAKFPELYFEVHYVRGIAITIKSIGSDESKAKYHQQLQEIKELIKDLVLYN